jgi:hypothetical protein
MDQDEIPANLLQYLNSLPTGYLDEASDFEVELSPASGDDEHPGLLHELDEDISRPAKKQRTDERKHDPQDQGGSESHGEHAREDSSSKDETPGEKKRPPLAKSWCFTLNNWTEEDVKRLHSALEATATAYAFQTEVGASGTPHIQGWVLFRSRRRAIEWGRKLLGHGRTHWERALGTNEQAANYCLKQEGFDGKHRYQKNVAAPVRVREPTYPWQKHVIELISKPADDRTIHWFWDEEGNTGKSTLAKFLYLNHNSTTVHGKPTDMFNGICNYKEMHNVWPKVIVIDVPRSESGFLSYGAVEKIKNGYFFSGKYKGVEGCFNSPHVIIFSNSPPDFRMFSADRWNIVNIKEFTEKSKINP